MARPKKQAALDVDLAGDIKAPISKYAKGGEMDHEPDDDLPMADIGVMNAEQLSQYGMRNLGMDFAGKSEQEMRESLTNQIGHRRAGGR